MFRVPYYLILTKTLTNERFKPSISSIAAVSNLSSYFQVTGIEILGMRKAEHLVVYILTQLDHGYWFLEDGNGTVRLNLSEAEAHYAENEATYFRKA